MACLEQTGAEQLRLDRRGGCRLRSELPVERDRADEDAQTDIVERLIELSGHRRRKFLGSGSTRRIVPIDRRIGPCGSSSALRLIVATLRDPCNRQWSDSARQKVSTTWRPTCTLRSCSSGNHSVLLGRAMNCGARSPTIVEAHQALCPGR